MYPAVDIDEGYSELSVRLKHPWYLLGRYINAFSREIGSTLSLVPSIVDYIHKNGQTYCVYRFGDTCIYLVRHLFPHVSSIS